MKKNLRFYKLLFVEILAIIGIGLFFFVDTSDVYKLFGKDIEFIEPSSPCDLHVDVCQASLKDKTDVSFEINPKHIPLMETLTFTAKIKGLAQNELPMKIYATNMNMGIHLFTLKRKEGDTFEAKGILPTCVVGNMIWRAEITIDRPQETMGAVFIFQTDK